MQLTDNQIHYPKYQAGLISETDAFDSLFYWEIRPELAYSSWIQGFVSNEGSKRVYLSMWNKFVRWLQAEGITIAGCSGEQVAAFLNASGIQKGQRQRYIRLIEKAYAHLELIGLDMPNPGQQAGFARQGAGHNDSMRFLSADEQDKIVRQMQSQSSGMIPDGNIPDWIKIRDAAIAGAILGGGARVGEVIRLSVNCTSYVGRIEFAATSKIPTRQARFDPAGEAAMNAWLECRRVMGMKGELLFPADIDRRRHDLQVPYLSMHPSTVFRRLNGLMEQAGIREGRACGQTLRNTYAANLLASGVDDGELAENMGLAELFSAERIRMEWMTWVLGRGVEGVIEAGRRSAQFIAPLGAGRQ